jgi:hypothetical protein
LDDQPLTRFAAMQDRWREHQMQQQARKNRNEQQFIEVF